MEETKKAEQKQEVKKPNGCLISILTIVGVFFFIGIIGTTIDVKDTEKNETQKPATNKSTSTIAKTPETLLNEVAKKALGEKLISTEIIQDDGMDIAIVRFKGSNNLTNRYIKIGMWLSAKDVFQKIYSNKSLKLDSVCVHGYFPLTDVYGNSKDSIVMRIEFNRETAGKVNWSGILTENIPVAANDYWEHPAFNE